MKVFFKKDPMNSTMALRQKIYKYLQYLATQERSAHKLALSFCVGNFIAFSPYFGLHSAMVVAFSWLFGLNFIVMFAAAYGINNPWTLIPVYSADYYIGHWLVHDICNLELPSINPTWLTTITNYIGIGDPCIWSFIIGGNLLAFVTSIALYPFMKYLFEQLQNSLEKPLAS